MNFTINTEVKIDESDIKDNLDFSEILELYEPEIEELNLDIDEVLGWAYQADSQMFRHKVAEIYESNNNKQIEFVTVLEDKINVIVNGAFVAAIYLYGNSDVVIQYNSSEPVRVTCKTVEYAKKLITAMVLA